MINLSEDKIEFLRNNRFYLYSGSEYSYISGRIGLNDPEFYNTESVEILIEDIKNGKSLDDKDSIQFNYINEKLYEIDLSLLQRISKRKNKETGETVIQSIIKPAFNTLYVKSILEVCDDYYVICERYTGDFGNCGQYGKKLYRSRKAAIKVALPLLEKKINEFKTQIDYVNELINIYENEI